MLGGGLSSRAIAWFSAGHFSHVDCILPSGGLLGARSDRIGVVAPGVQIRPGAYEKWKERVVMDLSAKPSEHSRFYEFLNSQLGKPYDKTAILGFATGREWRDPDAWFCSELQAAALEVSGRCPDLYTPRAKVTPAGLASIVSALGGIVSSYGQLR